MSNSPVCWNCGASLAALSLPFSRFDECKICHAALHACKLCKFYDIAVAKHCREPIAEEVKDKDRANFCDYFTVRLNAYVPQPLSATRDAKAALDALFGTPKTQTTSAEPSAQERAKAELEALFGKTPKS